MARDIISSMQEFANATVVIVEEVISEMEIKESQIKELKDQKMSLDASLSHQSIILKT